MTYCMLHKCSLNNKVVKDKCLHRKNGKFKCRHLLFLDRPLTGKGR